jgi:ADP-ribose pyrophosphatase YjhB (NUDIX family)
VSSLNPALEDVRFCPRCAAEATVRFPRSITCPHCGYGAYYHPKPVACGIPATTEGRIVLMRRATEPGRGLWTMPGGFVDLGESVEDAARREIAEELGIEVALGELIGVYSSSSDRTVVVVFAAAALGEPRTTEEAMEVRAFERTDIPWHHLAFTSDERALRDYLSRQDGPAGVPH